jgi:thiamine pyrophosphate-dependent acetolactate synthase large subunit-like protein
MLAAECYGELVRLWKDEVVVCSLGTTQHTWWRLTGSDRPFYMASSMGQASSFGLGLSLTLPQARVWVLNSDGSLVMNLGTLLTEAHHQPDNLVHFVLSNRVYDTIGGHDLTNAKNTDLAAMAKAAGVERTFTFRSVEEVREGLGEALSGGYAFVVFEVDRQPERESALIPFEGPEMKYRFGRHLERQFGITVFGPSGY